MASDFLAADPSAMAQETGSHHEKSGQAQKQGGKKGNDRACQAVYRKECLIYALDKQFTGTIREVSEGAVLIENEGSTEAINLEFVLRIREYPRNKKGKKKSVILD